MAEAVNIGNMLVRGLLVMLSLSAASESSAKSALYLLLQMPSVREVKRFMKNQDWWESCKAEKTPPDRSTFVAHGKIYLHLRSEASRGTPSTCGRWTS